MNILTDALPDAVEVSGRAVKIATDAATWMRFEGLLLEDAPDDWKALAALNLCLLEPAPDAGAALTGLLWFYRCGQTERRAKGGKGASARIYDFEADAALIYAAFWGQYGIDLQRDFLHWWQFRALFDGLGDEQTIIKVMGYRAMDVRKIKDKEQRRHYARLQAQYALRENISDEDKAKRAGAILAGGMAKG